MSNQPAIVLYAPSGATVELLAHCDEGIKYTARISINNTDVAWAGAVTEHEMDGNNLILDYAHIPLMDESADRAAAFLAETASYVAGKQDE